MIYKYCTLIQVKYHLLLRNLRQFLKCFTLHPLFSANASQSETRYLLRRLISSASDLPSVAMLPTIIFTQAAVNNV